MKKRYERPMILKLSTGFMNKFGRFSPYALKKVREKIDGVPVSFLVEKYGSPLFVFSEKLLKKKFKSIKEAFSLRYPNVAFAWSYKTNYLDAICAILHKDGEMAEVVSDFEYEKAKRLGVKGTDIVYNGPFKSFDSLKKAALEGAKINIDHFEEIYDLEKIADEIGQKIKVGIRINFDLGSLPRWEKFGFSLETGQALDAVKRIIAGGKLEVVGIHAHIGTFIVDPQIYALQVKKMMDFANQLEKEFSCEIEYIDIGGGFPSRSRLKGMYLPPDVGIPSIDDFAEAICETLLSCLSKNRYPKLIVESGRAIVDEAGFLITTVLATKRLYNGLRAYIIDAGVNLLFSAFWYHFNVELEKDIEGPVEPCVIYGPLCMNIDVVEDSCQLPPLSKGTRLILSPVGAYNVTQWMQFIQLRPAVVLITEEGKVELIREAETIEDIIRKERIPDYLKQ